MQPSPEKPILVYAILINETIMGSVVIKQTDQLQYKTSSHFTHCQHYVLSIQTKYVPDTLTFSELRNPICALMFILTQPEVSAVDPLDIIKEKNIRLTVLTDKTISKYLIQNWKNSSPQNWNCPSRDIVSLRK